MSDDDKELPWLEPAVEEHVDSNFLEHYRMAIIAAGIFVIVAFALIIWQVYSGGAVQPGGEVPLVKAEDGPEKVKPEEPGGMDIPDRDKLIYGRDAKQEDAGSGEHLRPGPETPMDKPQPDAAQPAQAAPPVQSAAVAHLPQNTAAATEGDYLIQLGAFSDRAKAMAVWQRIQVKFPGAVARLQPDVITLDRGSKGVLYRLQAGKLDSHDSAAALCKTLTAKGQPCIVVHR